MADRLISADKLKKHYEWWQGGTLEKTLDEMKRDFDTIVDLQPTVEPIKHGRWIKMSDADGIYWACSECGEDIPRVSHYNPLFDLFPRLESIDKTKYCPNCGSRMDAQIGEDKSHPFAESVMMGVDEVEE